MSIHRIVVDRDGHHKQGLRTEDADLAERWSRESAVNAKADGHIKSPCVIHFEPRHDDNPPAAVKRLFARVGIVCEFVGTDTLACSELNDAARRIVSRFGLSVYPSRDGGIRVTCAHAAPHGHDIIRSVHRLHVEFARAADGSEEVRAIHHYPERAADDESEPSAVNPLISKKQWAKIPAVASRRHCIVSTE